MKGAGGGEGAHPRVNVATCRALETCDATSAAVFTPPFEGQACLPGFNSRASFRFLGSMMRLQWRDSSNTAAPVCIIALFFPGGRSLLQGFNGVAAYSLTG